MPDQEFDEPLGDLTRAEARKLVRKFYDEADDGAEAPVPDRYRAGPLPDGLKCWAIYLADDPDLERPHLYPLRDEEMAKDLALLLNWAAERRTASRGAPPPDRT